MPTKTKLPPIFDPHFYQALKTRLWQLTQAGRIEDDPDQVAAVKRLIADQEAARERIIRGES